MFLHNKRLHHNARVSETSPGLENLMLEQFGGPQGELAAACRYFTQCHSEDELGRKGMRIDLATEELSDLEVIGIIVAMLSRGAERSSDRAVCKAEMYRCIGGGSNDSDVTQPPYGGTPQLTFAGGVPRSAACIGTIGVPAFGLRSSRFAAESRVKTVHERLIDCTDDPGVEEALGFLMTREISHRLSPEEALYAIQPNFSLGKLFGMEPLGRVDFNMSPGEGDARGRRNSEPNFELLEPEAAVDGEGSLPANGLNEGDAALLLPLPEHTFSKPNEYPLTGVERGTGAAMAATV